MSAVKYPKIDTKINLTPQLTIFSHSKTPYINKNQENMEKTQKMSSHAIRMKSNEYFQKNREPIR